jgi:hypothetical protein
LTGRETVSFSRRTLFIGDREEQEDDNGEEEGKEGGKAGEEED